jgi:TRAP-type transport system small permease protein
MADTPDAGSSAAPEPAGAAVTAGPTIEQLQQRYGGALVRWMRPVNTVMHVGAGLTMVALLGWTVVDIVGRAFFSSPLRGTVEITELAVVVLVYLGLARTESQDAHISVDLLYVRLGVRAKLALRVFAGVVSVAVLAVMTWRLWVYAGSLDAGGFTTGIRRIPLYPVALLGVLGAAMFTVALLVNLLVALRALVKGR